MGNQRLWVGEAAAAAMLHVALSTRSHSQCVDGHGRVTRQPQPRVVRCCRCGHVVCRQLGNGNTSYGTQPRRIVDIDHELVSWCGDVRPARDA